jgi:hypothetical protein
MQIRKGNGEEGRNEVSIYLRRLFTIFRVEVTILRNAHSGTEVTLVVLCKLERLSQVTKIVVHRNNASCI